MPPIRRIPKKEKVVSGSIKEATGCRDFNFSMMPARNWGNGDAFADAIVEFVNSTPPPWTHAKLAIHMGIGSVKSLYSFMDKGPAYKQALEWFNLTVEDNLIRGSMSGEYHGRTTEMYLRTYIAKYTESAPKEAPAKIQMVMVRSRQDLDMLVQGSRDAQKKLMNAASDAIDVATVVGENDDNSSK